MDKIKIRPRLRKGISLFAVVGLLTSLCGGIADSSTTVSPTTPGSPPIVRETAVTITNMPVAVTFSRSAAAPTLTNPNADKYAVAAPVVAGSAIGCRGDSGAIGTAGTGNNSPRTSLKVEGPGGIVLLDTQSPVIDTSVPGLLAGYPPLAVQPAPNTTNYRGGAPSGSAGATRPLVNTVDLKGKPPGIYTVTTVTRNMLKTGTLGACSIGTATIGTPTSAAGLLTDVQTFEYRPWQHVFTDESVVAGVNMNIAPTKEFLAKVGTQTSPVINGSSSMRMFAVPSAGPFLLPSDPAACASDPQSCLPSTAVECPEVTPGCQPRLVVINRPAPYQVQGVFDLETKAFVALANVRGSQRVLVSLGTESDAMYKALLAQLAAGAAAQGVDLMSILETKVRVRTGTTEVSLSLLNGLQIQPSNGTAGIQIVSDFTVQAGLILNIYSKLGGPICAVNKGDSNPETVEPDRYQALTDGGYTVEKSDLLPDVPKVGAVGALVGGPIYHLEGDFDSVTPALVNTSTAVIGVDTAADEPNGYPVWVEAVLSSPAHSTAARTMDFIGTATWSASETPVTGVGCLTVDFMLGMGVALYNNPLDIGFGGHPDLGPGVAAVAALIDQIDAAIQDAVTQVAGNPTVDALLQQLLDSLPGHGASCRSTTGAGNGQRIVRAAFGRPSRLPGRRMRAV